jgi:hypothetical protein
VSGKRMNVNDKLEELWEEAVAAYLKVLSLNFHGGNVENHEIHQ